MKKTLLLFVTACLISVNSRAEDFRTSGYMGFGEETVFTDFDDKWYGGVNTTHGYQINQRFFVGGGAGVFIRYKKSNRDNNKVGVPIYADFRYTMLKSKVTPFFEAKIGYCVADIDGFYASPTVGVDIAFTEKFGLYVALAYDYIGVEMVPL